MICTSRLPPTVTLCSGEWPCTSAEGESTRKSSAESSNRSPFSKATVSSLRLLDTRSSVGQTSLIIILRSSIRVTFKVAHPLHLSADRYTLANAIERQTGQLPYKHLSIQVDKFTPA